jgi:hypothetical protein
MGAHDARGFETPHPSQARGRRDSYFFGEVPKPAAIVLLQQCQQPTVRAVEDNGCHGAP